MLNHVDITTNTIVDCAKGDYFTRTKKYKETKVSLEVKTLH